jgi:hypothetical protein
VPIERTSSTLIEEETVQNFSNQTFNNEPSGLHFSDQIKKVLIPVPKATENILLVGL